MANSVKRKDLSKTDISWLKGYIGIIQKTVLAFYSKIESVYGYSNILYSQEARDEKVKINELIKRISSLIAATRGKQEFIDEIYDHVAQMYENLSEFINSNKSDPDFIKLVKNSYIDSEIKNQGKILGKIENLGEKKSGEKNYVPTNLKDLGWSAAYLVSPALAPAFDLGVSAFKAGKSGVNWAKRKISDFADSRKMNSSSSDKKASPLGAAMGASPFDLGETIQGGETSGESRSSTGQYAKGNTPWNKRTTPVETGTSSANAVKEKIELVDNFDHGLFKFFSTTAKKAPYLKELLEAVQGKGPKEEDDKKEKPLSLFGSGGLGNIAKMLGGVLTNPLVIGAAGIAMTAWDAVKGRQKSEQEGWLTGKAGQKQALGQNIASMAGGALGGTGKGLGEKGATIGSVATNALWNTVKGAAIGFMAGGPVGAVIGGSIGLAGGLVGGKRISQGLQAATRVLSGHDITTGEKAEPIAKKAASSNEVDLGKLSIKKSAMDFGELDDATGLPKDKSKMDAFRKQSRMEVLGSNAVEKVPVDTTKPDVQKGTKDGIDKLHSVMSEINNTLKDGSKNTSQKKPSGYDANNTRNPLLSSLGAGILDIA